MTENKEYKVEYKGKIYDQLTKAGADLFIAMNKGAKPLGVAVKVEPVKEKKSVEVAEAKPKRRRRAPKKESETKPLPKRK